MDKFNKMLASGEPMVLSCFRFITGLLLFQYGVAKIFKFPVGDRCSPRSSRCRYHGAPARSNWCSAGC